MANIGKYCLVALGIVLPAFLLTTTALGGCYGYLLSENISDLLRRDFTVPASEKAKQEAIQAVLEGAVEAVFFHKNGTISKNAGDEIVGVYSGSFNPLHSGHTELARVAREQLGGEVAYELSLANVDKGMIDSNQILTRVNQFKEHAPVVVTRASLFVDKAKLFPGRTFIIGTDTAERLPLLKYYNGDPASREAVFDELRRNNITFLVGARTKDGKTTQLSDCVIPEQYASMFKAIPLAEYNSLLSSSDVRAGLVAADPWDHTPPLEAIEGTYDELQKQYGLNQIPRELIVKPLPKIPHPAGHTFEDSLLAYVAKKFGLDQSKIELSAPPSPTRDASRVYLVDFKGKRIAVLKVFVKNDHEFLREVLSLRYLRESRLKDLHPVKAYGAAKVDYDGSLHGVLLMEPAPGLEIEGMVRRFARALRDRSPEKEISNQRQALLEATKRAGQGLAELHSRSTLKEPRPAVEKSYKEYELAKLNGIPSIVKRLLPLGLLTSDEFKQGEAKILDLAARFPEQVQRFSVIHGDAHLGNFYFDRQSNKFSAIDTEKLYYSVEEVADSVADAARFLGSLETSKEREHMPHAEIEALKRSFLDGYIEHRRKLGDNVDMSTLQAHMMRYYAVVLLDAERRGTNEIGRCMALNRMLRVLAIRSGPMTGICN